MENKSNNPFKKKPIKSEEVIIISKKDFPSLLSDNPEEEKKKVKYIEKKELDLGKKNEIEIPRMEERPDKWFEYVLKAVREQVFPERNLSKGKENKSL